MKWRIIAIAAVMVVAALALNAFVVSRATRPAQAFGGGRVLELDGPDLNVKEYSAGGDRVVVLLHGYSASVEWWDRVGAALLDQRVIAVDLVGHGGSEAPRDSTLYGIDGQAEAVDRALEALGVSNAVVVGHSMGGLVAIALAEQNPGRVERVAVSDTPAAEGLVEESALAGLACTPLIGPAVDVLRPVDLVTESSLQTGFAADYPVPQFAHRSLEQLTHTGVCSSGNPDDDRAAADRLAGLGKPVLVVWGERDVLTPTETNVARYRQAGLAPTVIPAAGHSPMVEAPGAFIAAVTDFVK
jgi:pimeloyl-ACP methyl ester carboxylesterase